MSRFREEVAALASETIPKISTITEPHVTVAPIVSRQSARKCLSTTRAVHPDPRHEIPTLEPTFASHLHLHSVWT